MTTWKIWGGRKLSGRIEIPPSKSHSLRALLFAALAQGESRLYRLLDSPDTLAMQRACIALGAQVRNSGGEWRVKGVSGVPKVADDVIHAGNSGLVLRLVGGVAALASGMTVLTGDRSVRSQRPVGPLLDGLRQVGGVGYSTRGNGLAPIVVGGPLQSGTVRVHGADSQPVSALMIALSLVQGESEIVVEEEGETPWLDLTLAWLHKVGVEAGRISKGRYRVVGGAPWKELQSWIPGDFSSAAFPAAAAIVTESRLSLIGLQEDETQGDRHLFALLAEMGVEVQTKESSLLIGPGKGWQGGEIDINSMIDALPIVATLACFGHQETRIRNGAIARYKECDRIAVMTRQLRRMGADIEELEDGMVVRPSVLHGTQLDSCGDHRVALSLLVAALGARGVSEIKGAKCAVKTYADFPEIIKNLGAEVAW